MIIYSTYKSTGWRPEIANAFKSMKLELFANSPMKAAYDAIPPDKTKWIKFLEQIIAYAGEPFDMGMPILPNSTRLY
ncbi:hypothetical protein EPL05_19130 [Mucilaginibacter gilvus]|uniref:Uncharacterized protein n=1 Tax=Mucilaginibacter gilvus TaxID=2305909 RepID=A0A3S3V9H7_9SPHI|nr:hypothetical protein EPL05_19130 [Mucilaginibacter gilvus]